MLHILNWTFCITGFHKSNSGITSLVVEIIDEGRKEERKEMFNLMMHSTHFIYGYMAFDIW